MSSRVDGSEHEPQASGRASNIWTTPMSPTENDRALAAM